jgi:hypothetical protein
MFIAWFFISLAVSTQDAQTAPVVLLVESTQKLQLASGKEIRKAVTANPTIARVTNVFEPTRTVRLTGVSTGHTKVTFTDVDGMAATYEVEVKSNRLNLTVGSTIVLQLTSKKPIRRVMSERESVAQVRPIPTDPTSVMVTGVSVGRTRITLTGDDGDEEVRELGRK